MTFVLIGVACPTSLPAEIRERPNIVFILADDLGYHDVTLYGISDLYQTPNIQRLAQRGMLFTNAYSASPLCSPTRSAILTGLTPARTGITAPNCHLPQVVLRAKATATGPSQKPSTIPTVVTRLGHEYETLAERLREEGYSTGHFGKWHLGPEPYSPLEHGFDVDVPHWPGPGPAGGYVAPWRFPDFDPATPTEHIEDRMADEAAAFMRDHADEPFFLNYWMFSVHAPFDAKADVIESYRSRINPQSPRRSPTYAAMIQSMDDAVGTLLDAIDRLGLADNTIIVFTSDNGGNMYNEIDGVPPTSNSPLRGGKATIFEGGIRSPQAIVWPSVVTPGSRCDDLTNSCDFYPTILEMIDRSPRSGQVFDGISLVPALRGGALDRDWIFTYFPHDPPVPDWLPPSATVRRGDWKLIRLFHAGENGQHRYKLYDLATDIGETNNVAAAKPDLVAELDALIESSLVSTDAARPLPNPNFDVAKYDLADEGVPKMRVTNPRPAKSTADENATPVAGWRPVNQCRLVSRGDGLQITSLGQDPFLVHELPASIPPQRLTVTVTMSSSIDAAGQLFWREQGVTPPFAAARRRDFAITSDGQSMEYSVNIQPQKPVTAIRLDPARSPGEASLLRLVLTDEDGQTVYQWNAAAAD